MTFEELTTGVAKTPPPPPAAPPFVLWCQSSDEIRLALFMAREAGEEIQIHKVVGWVDWEYVGRPAFNPEEYYRVKPKEVYDHTTVLTLAPGFVALMIDIPTLNGEVIVGDYVSQTGQTLTVKRTDQ